MFEVLNAYKKIKRIGMNRNSMMRTAPTRRKMRVPTPSIIYLPFLRPEGPCLQAWGMTRPLVLTTRML